MTTCLYYVSNSLDISGLVGDEKKINVWSTFSTTKFYLSPKPTRTYIYLPFFREAASTRRCHHYYYFYFFQHSFVIYCCFPTAQNVLVSFIDTLSQFNLFKPTIKQNKKKSFRILRWCLQFQWRIQFFLSGDGFTYLNSTLLVLNYVTRKRIFSRYLLYV